MYPSRYRVECQPKGDGTPWVTLGEGKLSYVLGMMDGWLKAVPIDYREWFAARVRVLKLRDEWVVVHRAVLDEHRVHEGTIGPRLK